MQNFIVIDIETTGVNFREDQIHGIGVAYDRDEIEYYRDLKKVLAYLRDTSVVKVGHNLRFDLSFLQQQAGIVIKGPIHDTMLMAKELDVSQPLGLDVLAVKYLGDWAAEHKHLIDKACHKYGVNHVGELAKRSIQEHNEEISKIIAEYCKKDCFVTYQLFIKLKDELIKLHKKTKFLGKTPLDYYKEETIKIEPVLQQIELRGINIDVNKMKDYEKVLSKEQANLMFQLRRLCLPKLNLIEEGLYEKECNKRKSTKGKDKILPHSDKYKTKFLWSSNKHVGELFYDHLGLSDIANLKTRTGAWNVAGPVLTSLIPKIENKKLKNCLETFIEYKKSLKAITTYVGEKSEYRPKKGSTKIYPRYLQGGRGKLDSKGGTTTGRLSSAQPNMQNLPRLGPVKEFFIPNKHQFLIMDYSQLELRLAAHLSKDKELTTSFLNNEDPHLKTAMAVLDKKDITPEERTHYGKTLNFALIYGASAFKLYKEFFEELGISLEEVEHYRDNFFKLYSGYKDYLSQQLQLMFKYNAVISPYGRLRRLPDLKLANYLNFKQKKFTFPATFSKNFWIESLQPQKIMLPQNVRDTVENRLFYAAFKKYKHAVNSGYNHPIQSMGASLTKRTMIKLFNLGYDIVTQVHDSIIIEIPKTDLTSIKECVNIMENIEQLNVPLKVEYKIGSNFNE